MIASRFALVATAFALLTACGGGSNGDSGGSSVLPGGGAAFFQGQSERQIRKRLQDDLNLAERIGDLPGTAFTAMPTSGRARFDGIGGILIDPDGNRPIPVLGDASVVATFRNGKLDGIVDNLVSARPGRLSDVAGSVRIGGNGSSIGKGAPNDASASYRGRLRIDGRGDFVVSGRANGTFRGTRASSAGTAKGPRALVLEDENTRIIGPSGRALTGVFGITVEN